MTCNNTLNSTRKGAGLSTLRKKKKKKNQMNTLLTAERVWVTFRGTNDLFFSSCNSSYTRESRNIAMIQGKQTELLQFFNPRDA